MTSGVVYALRIAAIAGPHCGKKLGDQHALLVMIRRNSEEEARRAVVELLNAHSWQSPEILQMKAIDVAEAEQANLAENTMHALRMAQAHGFSMVVFDDPIPKN